MKVGEYGVEVQYWLDGETVRVGGGDGEGQVDGQEKPYIKSIKTVREIVK